MMELTAVMLGFAGSLHCAAMCSPLSVAAANLSSRAFFSRLLYNGGRILTYSILGALVSSIGFITKVGMYQNIVALLLASVLLIVGCSGVNIIRIPFVTPMLNRFTLFLKMKFALLFAQKSDWSKIALGMLNGILPCGLTMIALGYTIVLKGPSDGFLFMLLFGLATLPAMLGSASILHLMTSKLNLKPAYLNNGLIIFSGFLLLARVFWLASIEAHQTGQHVIDIVMCR